MGETPSRSLEKGAILEVDQLSKTYYPKNRPTVEAVKGITLTISSGECFGLLGPNGAGKSTSMNCISGFYAPTTGTVKIAGVDVHKDPHKARFSLGVCQQDETLDTDFTLLNQLVRHASFFRIPTKEAKAKAIHLLQRFGLEDKKDGPVEALSGGMRRRLQVARSLIADPRLLILDEPTTGLDPEARRSLWDIIHEEKKKGMAILLSTHYMEEAERICDRVAIMARGKIHDCNNPQQLIVDHMGTEPIEEEIRQGVRWQRPANLEDVYLKVTGVKLASN